MSGLMKRYRAGEKFKPSAGDLNRIADLVERMDRLEMGIVSGKSPPVAMNSRQGTILVRNESGAVVPRFGVMDVGAPIILPEDNEAEYVNRPSLKGLLPMGVTSHGVVLVAQQPIGEGRIGRCVCAGLTIAKVKVRDTNHTHAELEADEAILQSAFAGPARIIHLPPVDPELDEEDPDIRLALVLLGPVERVFDGEVTAKTAIVAGQSWEYTVQERVYGGDGEPLSDAEGLREVTALHKLESYNVAGTRTAPGILQTDHEDAIIMTLPIDVGCPVEVHEVFPAGWERGDSPLYFIRPLPNPILADCIPEEE